MELPRHLAHELHQCANQHAGHLRLLSPKYQYLSAKSIFKKCFSTLYSNWDMQWEYYAKYFSLQFCLFSVVSSRDLSTPFGCIVLSRVHPWCVYLLWIWMIISQQLQMHSWAHTVLTPNQQRNYYCVLLAKSCAF